MRVVQKELKASQNMKSEFRNELLSKCQHFFEKDKQTQKQKERADTEFVSDCFKRKMLGHS